MSAVVFLPVADRVKLEVELIRRIVNAELRLDFDRPFESVAV
jgi:hypothetical protein